MNRRAVVLALSLAGALTGCVRSYDAEEVSKVVLLDSVGGWLKGGAQPGTAFCVGFRMPAEGKTLDPEAAFLHEPGNLRDPYDALIRGLRHDPPPGSPEFRVASRCEAASRGEPKERNAFFLIVEKVQVSDSSHAIAFLTARSGVRARLDRYELEKHDGTWRILTHQPVLKG